MKKMFKPFMMMATVAGILAVSSCTKDDREKFEGTWLANESSGAPFNVTVVAGDGATVKIGNFSGVFVNSVIATVSGNNFTIAAQTPDASATDDYTVSGTGVYSKSGSSETIAVDYFVVSVADTINAHVTGTWTKQ